ncbi:MAG: hypothetical protein HUJ29_13400, partial [Gammaproteobacteria bacterium]|nr:hypothetical protein [Gammaproteobacteria bacterium]
MDPTSMFKAVWPLVLLFFLTACGGGGNASNGDSCDPTHIPEARFKANSQQLAVYQSTDCSYADLFIKGVNLGVASPGKYAGDLETAATYEDFIRWFGLMTDAGINVVRVYTLHMDFFYDAVYDFNIAREAAGEAPLYIAHGIWLDEAVPAVDLYSVTDGFSTNIREVIDAVHGDVTLDYVGRPGKGYGTYTSDVSPW